MLLRKVRPLSPKIYGLNKAMRLTNIGIFVFGILLGCNGVNTANRYGDVSANITSDKKLYRFGEEIYLKFERVNVGNVPVIIKITNPAFDKKFEGFVTPDLNARISSPQHIYFLGVRNYWTVVGPAPDYRILKPGERVTERFRISDWAINEKGDIKQHGFWDIMPRKGRICLEVMFLYTPSTDNVDKRMLRAVKDAGGNLWSPDQVLLGPIRIEYE